MVNVKIYRPLSRLAKLFGSAIFHGLTILFRRVQKIQGKSPPASCIVLCYHAVAAGDRMCFARQMDTLIRNAEPVRPDNTKALLPGKRYVAITFDDGHQSVVENALPELREREIPCAIFIISDLLGQSAPWSGLEGYSWEDKYITQDVLCQLPSDLVIVGSHTSTHPRLSSVSEAEARRELEGSRNFLEKAIFKEVSLFAFPYGDHNQSLLDRCMDAGYRRVFTVEPVMAFSEPHEFVSGRVMVEPRDWPIELYLKIQGAYRWLALVFEWRDVIRGMLGSRSRVTTGNRERARVREALRKS